MDRPEDRLPGDSPEELSGDQVLPGGDFDPEPEGSPAQPEPSGVAAPPSQAYDPRRDKPDYRIRLMALRDKAMKLHNALSTIVQIFVVVIVTYILYYVSYIFMMMFMVAGGIASSSSGPGNYPGDDMWMVIVPFIGVAVGIVAGISLAYALGGSIRRWINGMHLTRYRMAESYLHHTDFLRVVAEEDFTHIIIDAVNDIPSLKWISPSRPKTLEQQLEFSSCYWNSIVQLSYGPGRLDNASLFHGSWNHQVSRWSPYSCCACCCLSGSLWIITFPATIITANYHLYRVARLVCTIDYLIEDRFAGSGDVPAI
ncbi:hypothetical protein KDL44_07545 [bacterium]|nr:hypothetical protein [bacterium]